eukprot:3594916-Ditylum_brightwellii.AAC.1
MDRLKQCSLPDEISDWDIMSAFSYLIKAYMSIQGWDFVRKLMGHAKTSSIIGHRQQIATLCKSKKTESDIKTEDEKNKKDHKEMSTVMDSLEVI